jgi:hypothetical protein
MQHFWLDIIVEGMEVEGANVLGGNFISGLHHCLVSEFLKIWLFPFHQGFHGLPPLLFIEHYDWG